MRSKNKHYNEAYETIICALVIVIIISAFGILMVNSVTKRNSYKNSITEADIWEQEFKKVEENRVGIIFNGVTTTEDEYNVLRVSCNNYIENSEDSIDLDANIDVEVTVNEDTFVDKSDNEHLSVFNLPKSLESKQSKSSNEFNMVETGPIYFNNLLMIRYINDFGELKIVCSTFTDDIKTNIISFNQSDINKYYKITDDHSNENKSSNKQISEDKYVSTISECIKNLLLSKNIQDERDAISESLSYFTLDGKNTVLKSRESFNITDDTTIELVTGIAGKSDTSKTIKDRIYLQYKINSNGEVRYTNIIIKLNSNLRIFDIDII